MAGFDPWLDHPMGRGSTSKKKTTRLAGKEPSSGTVHVLIKLHNWAGRAIYLYNLVTGDMRHIPQPSDEMWEQYNKLGIEIPHPSKIPADAAEKWVEIGRREAQRRGLKVAE